MLCIGRSVYILVFDPVYVHVWNGFRVHRRTWYVRITWSPCHTYIIVYVIICLLYHTCSNLLLLNEADLIHNFIPTIADGQSSPKETSEQ
ncbi:hypothetical protein BJ166DRAFT_541239 [Pestalotiopsis sp. NC0098]|nr:hypothetical protein BJ166DRAFT_541239 [Pestalotiopsis sp. NC0098]